MSDPPDKPFDLAAALTALPLFPLPQAVLLPGALLPLHVFEPRYRKMVRDAVDGHAVIGLVCIPAPNRVDESGQPRIARVAGAGVIMDYSELPSGRFNILLRGRARVSLEELPFEPPYRRARATVLPSTDENVSSTHVAALVSSATAFVSLVRERDRSFDFRMPKLSNPSMLVDHCAQHLLIDVRDRQTVLETTSVAARILLVTETLAMQQLTLSGDTGGMN